MKSTLLSRRDLEFLLYEWLQVDELTKRDRFAEHSRETFDAVLELCEQLATRYFAPHNKKSDANEPTFDGERVTGVDDLIRLLTAERMQRVVAVDVLRLGKPRRFWVAPTERPKQARAGRGA